MQKTFALAALVAATQAKPTNAQLIDTLLTYRPGDDVTQFFASTHVKDEVPRVNAWASSFPQVEKTAGLDLSSIGFLGYTLLDGVEFAEGVASGLFGEDVRSTWGQCLTDIPKIAMDGYDQVKDVKIDDPSDIGKDLSQASGLIGWIMSLLGKAPSDFKACPAIYTDSMHGFNWIVHHISLSQMGANVVSNIMANGLKIAGDGWEIVSSFTAHDLYTTGKDLGTVVMLLIN